MIINRFIRRCYIGYRNFPTMIAAGAAALTVLSVAAYAEEYDLPLLKFMHGDVIAINEENFHGDKFRAFVSENYDLNHDDQLDENKISAVTSIDLAGSTDISDLTGIGYFTVLDSFICSGNSGLHSIDLSKNTALSTLKISRSGLTALDLSNNISLEVLELTYNADIHQLDLSSCTELTTLNCSSNGIANIDLSKNTKLKAPVIKRLRNHS